MNDKIKGIVLNISDYKENDLILQVITEDRSFLSLIAKSAKKINSKKTYLSSCVYEFIIDYKDNKTIYTIHNAKLIDNYYDDNNLKLISFKNILLELTLKSKDLYSKELYNNLIFSLKNINEDNIYLHGSLFISFILKVFGINPMVDGCVVCGNSKVVGISNRYGGFMCVEHNGLEKNYDIETLKKFRLINKAEYNNYEAIKNIEYNLADFNLMINFFIENSDINLKSYKLYKEMFGI